MKYLKFILKCILAASPAVVIIAFTLLCPLCYMDEEYPAWRYTKDVVYSSEGDFSTLILGDSGAMSSFIPEELSDSTVNLAVGGATSIEMYYFLKNYIENHGAPENVVIMFAPFHYFTIDNYSTRTMYFKALTIKDAAELYENAEEAGADLTGTESVFWDEFACRCALPTKYLPALCAARFVGRYDSNSKKLDAITAARGYGTFGELDGCDGESYECSYSSMDYSGKMELITIYIQKIYSLCVENGIDAALIQPALNETSYNNLNPDYAAGYSAYIQTIKGLCPQMKVETELRCYPNEYFGDVSHLNGKGAAVFSKEIKSLYPELFD